MKHMQLRSLIRQVLSPCRLYSEAAEELLILTAAAESLGGQYIYQMGGPAVGIFQMEPNTHDDIWENYLEYKPELALETSFWTHSKDSEALVYNLAYAILMARIHYLRVAEPLPSATDIDGLAYYWKKYYNTYRGKGTVRGAKEKYLDYIAG